LADHVLDARGLQCPLPVLRANKMLKSLPAGAELEILATDPAAPNDFASFCKTTGHVLVESHEADGAHVIVVRKAGAGA
jgi:tRNA 2-thiouridine synthesizing protein A